MPDCTICLVNFASEDEVIVFSCDSKHYFHTKCGSDWLLVKAECPLCRFDFSPQIAAFIQSSEDIHSEVAREAINESSSNLQEPPQQQPNQQANVNELVSELT